MKSVFEEFSVRVHRSSGGYVCAMMEEYIVPLIQRVKHAYVVKSMDRVDSSLSDVECLVLFEKTEPEPSNEDDHWIEDYGDDLYYK